ncbi:hypothetical protein GC093_11075 [Paenibacillus sp. LMG 31456]|uniref:Uncharacterized protein n=1 Tax=Paenibacillus foliorum TaxID=2654974 RepID=A0A972K0E7_9BACL|nr:hypothetical protein [Paenibacillus foliorum]NOU93760.1 hypothetical protein [Paenibacillus foliorum]
MSRTAAETGIERRNARIRSCAGEYIESYVLSQLQEKIFNDEAIPLLAKQLNDFHRSKETGIKEAKERLEKSLEGIERQTINIVNTIATLIDKLEELEKQKFGLEQKLMEVRSQNEKAAITEESLKQLLSQFGTHLANRDLPEIKKFLGSYVGKGHHLRKACRSFL